MKRRTFAKTSLHVIVIMQKIIIALGSSIHRYWHQAFTQDGNSLKVNTNVEKAMEC